MWRARRRKCGWRWTKRARASSGDARTGRMWLGDSMVWSTQRSKRVSNGASRKMTTVPGVCSRSRRLVSCSGVPPPRARMAWLRDRAFARALDSSRRKWGSPCSAKSSETVARLRCSMWASRSRNSQPRASASMRPTVVLPAPMKPMRTMRRTVVGRVISEVVAGLVWVAVIFFNSLALSWLVCGQNESRDLWGRGSVDWVNALF